MYLQAVLHGGVLWIFGGNYNSLPIATTHRITRDTDSKTLYIFDYHNIDYDDDDEKNMKNIIIKS